MATRTDGKRVTKNTKLPTNNPAPKYKTSGKVVHQKHDKKWKSPDLMTGK